LLPVQPHTTPEDVPDTSKPKLYEDDSLTKDHGFVPDPDKTKAHLEPDEWWPERDISHKPPSPEDITVKLIEEAKKERTLKSFLKASGSMVGLALKRMFGPF
jgi:hypothetical protein